MKANITFKAVCMALLLSASLFFAGCSTNPDPESDTERLIGKWCCPEGGSQQIDYYYEFTEDEMNMWIYGGMMVDGKIEGATFKDGIVYSTMNKWQRIDSHSYTYDKSLGTISAEGGVVFKVEWRSDDEIFLSGDEELGLFGTFYRIKKFENVEGSSTSPFESGTHCWEVTINYEGGNSETVYFWGTEEEIFGMMPMKTTFSYTIVSSAKNEDACEALDQD